MTETCHFLVLTAAIDTTPIVDNHAHPLLERTSLSKIPLVQIATEADGAAIHDAPNSLSHIRAVKHLAQILGCEQTWEAVEASIEEKRASSHHRAWVKRCLDGIETILIDDGLYMRDQSETYSWHDQFTKSKCKRIVRIEIVAEDIMLRLFNDISISADDNITDYFLKAFEDEIKTSIADDEVVGFKSIICYRGGLDIPARLDLSMSAAASSLRTEMDTHRAGIKPFRRLESRPLNLLILHRTAQLIDESGAAHKKPIQFHTGLGDNDITLTKSSPSHLQTFIRDYPELPIVILHAGYPWTREAAYLAAVYSNVYLDIGEVFPQLSRHGQEQVVRQSLELGPWSKILFSTDGHWLPETYLLATIQARSVLKTVLGELVQTQQLDERQAVRVVQGILFNNSKQLYNLQLRTTLPSYDQLTPAPAPAPAPLTAAAQSLRQRRTKYVRMYWHDYTSSAKCRVLPAQQIHKLARGGKAATLSITRASLGLLQNDTLIPQATPAGAYTYHPDWSTLRPGPAAGHASCYGELREADGSESPLCPRTVLRRAVERAARHGLAFLLGFEIEFVVLECLLESYYNGVCQYRELRGDGHAWSSARALADWGSPGEGSSGGFGAAFDEILDGLERAGVEVEQFHAESAPGQFEIVLAPLPPLAAVEGLLHARQVLECAAARRGFRVSLHPKPFAGKCGSASHVHMSVSSSASTSTSTSTSTSASDDGDPAVYEPFYAGILHHLRAIAAFAYSSPASYERAVDHCWAGGRWVAWGTENREAPLRKVAGSHWEVKALDGLANPYFAVAALLAAGTDGVRTAAPLRWRDCGEDPARLSPGQRAALGIDEMLPADLPEALRALAADRELWELLGPEFVQRYIDVKTAELALLKPMNANQQRSWLLERY